MFCLLMLRGGFFLYCFLLVHQLSSPMPSLNTNPLTPFSHHRSLLQSTPHHLRATGDDRAQSSSTRNKGRICSLVGSTLGLFSGPKQSACFFFDRAFVSFPGLFFPFAESRFGRRSRKGPKEKKSNTGSGLSHSSPLHSPPQSQAPPNQISLPFLFPVRVFTEVKSKRGIYCTWSR